MRTFIALALIGTSLAGCGGTVNRSLESVHQPVVSRTDYVYDLPAPADRLSVADDSRLTAWFDSLKLRYGDRVSVDTQGYGQGARDAVASVAARYGLLIDEVPPLTQGAVPQGSVRVIVSRLSASVPGCPDYSRPGNVEFGGNLSSNYGCATNATLAAMIADPNDLLQGRNGDTGAIAASDRALTNYRKGAVKDLKVETSRGGAGQ